VLSLSCRAVGALAQATLLLLAGNSSSSLKKRKKKKEAYLVTRRHIFKHIHYG
jgi:hypothetical protein